MESLIVSMLCLLFFMYKWCGDIVVFLICKLISQWLWSLNYFPFAKNCPILRDFLLWKMRSFPAWLVQFALSVTTEIDLQHHVKLCILIAQVNRENLLIKHCLCVILSIWMGLTLNLTADYWFGFWSVKIFIIHCFYSKFQAIIFKLHSWKCNLLTQRVAWLKRNLPWGWVDSHVPWHGYDLLVSLGSFKFHSKGFFINFMNIQKDALTCPKQLTKL